MHADPLADVAVEALHALHGRWWPMVLKALEDGVEAVPDAPPELAALIASLPPEPTPEDWEKMNRGSAAVARAGDSAGLVLQCASLMIDYWSPPAMKPLVMTGALQKQTIHRLTQTNAWWIELHRPGGLQSNQDGYRTTIHVRLIHAFVRRMIHGSGAWDREAWGEPINQADLFFQVVGFSKLMVDNLQRMGYWITAEEKEGYFLFWRHVAALLGVEKSLLPSVNETDCGRYWDLWMLTNPGPDAEGIALARATLRQRPAPAIRRRRCVASSSGSCVEQPTGCSAGISARSSRCRGPRPDTSCRWSTSRQCGFQRHWQNCAASIAARRQRGRSASWRSAMPLSVSCRKAPRW
jgi:hypothetical protein